MGNATDSILDAKEKSKQFVKNRIFDVIALGIIVSMTALSLGVLELRDISIHDILNIIVECIPFYLASMLLTTNYYTKGTFIAKLTDKFDNAVNYYSELVDKVDGKQMKMLPDFCKMYNERTLKNMRESMLKSVGITFKQFDEDTIENNKIHKALKTLSKAELLKLYNKDIVKVICKCKKVKIKGININILLGNINSNDPTDLGKTEKELSFSRRLNYALSYLLSIFVMALIGVKDVFEWGWIGILFTVFKLLYIACSSYMKYFQGYEDISTYLVSHLYRKSDVLKEFFSWYEDLNVVNQNENFIVTN